MELWILLLIMVVLVLCIITVKLYYKSLTGICTSKRQMHGHTVLITGANTGIGLETAKDLAQRGARVLLACRDPQRGKKAEEEVRAVASGDAGVELLSLDLGSLASVRACARLVNETEPRLDILINNAGAWGLSDALSEDGLHLGLQINHFGPFLLTILLLDLICKSAPSRIIFLSSVMHHHSPTLYPEMLDYPRAKTLSNYQIYNMSKLVNILVSNELAKRLQGTGVTVNSVHPGIVFTEIHRHYPFYTRYFYSLAMKLIYKNAREGAQTSIYAAVSEEVEGKTGHYFVDCKDAPVSQQARHERLAREIWTKSEALVCLKSSERLQLVK